MKESQLDRIEKGQRRLEQKMDALLEALAEEDDAEGQFDLDGNLLGPDNRDQSESLG